MDISGEYRIPASRETVWQALNDPEVLKACIPGCDEIIKTSDTELDAKVTAKVGPVKAKFTGHVTLSDLDPPNGYRISGEGKGGAAGFAKGGADVTLQEADGGNDPALYGERERRRKAGPDRFAPHRLHRQENGRPVLRRLRRKSRRRGGTGGGCRSGGATGAHAVTCPYASAGTGAYRSAGKGPAAGGLGRRPHRHRDHSADRFQCIGSPMMA